MNVANRLKELREHVFLSQAELARRSGIGQGSISAIESGKQSPTAETLSRLCSVLGVSLSEFFADEVPEPELPPYIRELLETIRHLDPEQVAQLTELLKSFMREE